MDCSPPGSSVHGILRHEYWSGLSFPPPRDLPNPGIKPASPALAGRFSTTEPPRKPPWKSHIYTHFWFQNFEAACCIATQLEMVKVFLSLTHTLFPLFIYLFSQDYIICWKPKILVFLTALFSLMHHDFTDFRKLRSFKRSMLWRWILDKEGDG